MRTRLLIFVLLAAILGATSAACHGDGKDDPKLKDPPEKPDVPNPPEEDEALILSTEREVLLRPKGATAFVPILRNVPFHAGDTLRVGDAAKAVVFCNDVCELGAGEYTRCCTPVCRVVVNIQPANGQQSSFFVMKKDLPPEQARLLEGEEIKIANLRLGDAATQFLRANLYSRWKLTEANGELQLLNDKLDKKEAKQELRQLYAPVMRKTGDLLIQVDQKDKAEQRYKKTVEIAPDSTSKSDPSLSDKATAHDRLADIYVESGKKTEAVESLNRARQIYVRQGDAKKVEETDRKIRTYKNK